MPSPNRLAISSDICAFGIKLLILDVSSPPSLVLMLPNRWTLVLVGTCFGTELCVSVSPSPVVYILTSVIETAVVGCERRLPLAFEFAPCDVDGREDIKVSSLGLGGRGGRSSRVLDCAPSCGGAAAGSRAGTWSPCLFPSTRVYGHVMADRTS